MSGVYVTIPTEARVAMSPKLSYLERIFSNFTAALDHETRFTGSQRSRKTCGRGELTANGKGYA